MMWRRKQSIVNFRHQFWFALELLVVAIGFDLLCAFFLFVPPFSDFFGGGAVAERLLAQLKGLIFLKWPLICIAMIVFVIVGILLSHRLWGPLYGLQRVIAAWRSGDRTARVRFRKYDYLLPAKEYLNDFLDAEDEAWRKVEDLTGQIRDGVDQGNTDRVRSASEELLRLAKPEITRS